MTPPHTPNLNSVAALPSRGECGFSDMDVLQSVATRACKIRYDI